MEAVSVMRGLDRETVLVNVLAGLVTSAMGEETAMACAVAAAAMDIGDGTAPWTALGVCRASSMVNLSSYTYARDMESATLKRSAFAMRLGAESPARRVLSTGLGTLLLAHLEQLFFALHYIV